MAFHGKTALVTGAASGMGRLAALRLAEQGARVAVMDLNEEGLQETASQSANITAFPCDVSDRVQVEAVIAEVMSQLGSIDRLTHAAAIMPGGSLVEMSTEQINRLMVINYCGTVNVTKAVLPGMLQRRSGDMIIFGSMAGDVLTHNLGAYSATKAATNVYAEILARENQGCGIRFLLVCPPAVNTPLINQALVTGPESLRYSQQKGRLAKPEVILDAIEKALEKGKWVVRPGEAAVLTWIRRMAPGLLWKLMEKANQPS